MTAAKRAVVRGPIDALGLAVPPRFSESWWQQALRSRAAADQFEARYSLLFTRG